MNGFDAVAVPEAAGNALPPQVFELRGTAVILDADAAAFFGTTTKRLNQQIRRNAEKFGSDFAFMLSPEEAASLRSQIVTSSQTHGGARYTPFVLTEHGVVMAATVLRTPQAISASRLIVKAFVDLKRTNSKQTPGQNLPTVLNPANLLPLATSMRQELATKINRALTRVLDTIADPDADTTIRDEAQAIAAEGIRSLKEYLRKNGVQNEKTLAEIRKIMAEAESLEAETRQKHTENRHRELALLAKQLRLVLSASQFVETGEIESLLNVLRELEAGPH